MPLFKSAASEKCDLVLILTSSDVKSLLKMDEAINTVEKSFVELARGRASMTERAVITDLKKDGWMGVMTAHLRDMRSLGSKIITVFTHNERDGRPTTQGVVILVDPDSGDLLSIIEAGWLTAIRTGAASGVATKFLARKESKTIGLFGAGIQARTQLMGMLCVREIESVKLYVPSRTRAESFAAEMSQEFGIKFQIVPRPNDGLLHSDIVITATTSKIPIFDGSRIESGTHINCVGAHTKDARELDSFAINVARVVVDLRSSAMKEAGEILIPMKGGDLHMDILELADVVSGKVIGRNSPSEITIFKSTGISIEDISTAKLVYGAALRAGVGKEISMDSNS